MPHVEFTPQYSVGVGSIDQQHKKLFDLMNMLYDAMAVGKGNAVVQKIVGELVDYTKYHFANEEGMMRQVQYAKFPEHKQKHDALVAKVVEFQRNIEKGMMAQAVPLNTFLKDWLIGHIQAVDKQYSETFIKGGLH